MTKEIQQKTLLMKKILHIIFTALPLSCWAQPRAVWSPDNGDGSYTNPVLYADYSDPDVCAVGEDYYLTASSFNCVPGLPILHSKDLVNWTLIGHALQELTPRQVFDNPAHGKGVWAPSIRQHNDTLYIYWGDPDQGIFMVKAPLTPQPAMLNWCEPVCVIEGRGMIDPCPLWDDDGRCYLVNAWANSRAGFNSVLSVRELSADGTRAIGLPRIVFDGGQDNHTAEGPKFYKRNDWYWIMCPAGGVEKGWQWMGAYCIRRGLVSPLQRQRSLRASGLSAACGLAKRLAHYGQEGRTRDHIPKAKIRQLRYSKPTGER